MCKVSILLISLGLNSVCVRAAESFHDLSLYFGAIPSAYFPDEKSLEVHQFAICELAYHVSRSETLPKAKFRDPQLVAPYAPNSYTIDTVFYNASGQAVESLDRLGAFGALLTVKTETRTYTFWRHLYRLPKGAEEPADTSERAALLLMARQALGRAWTAADPALYTYALQWRKTWEQARGEFEPLQWFALYPPDYQSSSSNGYPALLYLHGGGGKRFTLEQLKQDRFYDSFKPILERGCIVIVPQSPQPWQAGPVMELLDRVLAELPIDPNRLVIAGHSMGGSGVWRVLDGEGAPERFAGAAPVSGGRVPPQWRTPRYTSVPLRIVYGENEDPRGLSENAAIAKAINEAGGSVTYIEFSGANHMQCRNWTFSDPEFFDWVMEQHRDRPFPVSRARK